MLPRIDGVIEKVRKYNPVFDEELLKRAYLFSAWAHEGQVRFSGEPYLIHPVGVADILADLKADNTALVAGLLHDVVEDNHAVKLPEIAEKFGAQVAHVVEGVTKIEEKIPVKSREEREWASLRKVVLAMVDDVRVILVKLSDRLHNLRTMDAMPKERRPFKALETLQIYAPIAGRLGLGRIRTELEVLGFKYAYPEQYDRLSAALKNKRDYSEDFIEKTSKELRVILEENDIKGTVSGRVKHIFSIQQKLERQGIDVEKVYDYMAFRVLVNSVRDCYAVLGGIHGKWKPVPGRFKDFIAIPKENNYRSLHNSVIGPNGSPFEIQIRTYEMHDEAENGIAAHWCYKDGQLSKGDKAESNRWMRKLLELKQEEANDTEFVNKLRVDLRPRKVFVFTPKGKVLSFPHGATPIDFAYAIHTDVGHHCIGAKINERQVALKTPLTSGDRVEIVTSPAGHPSRDWLQAAVTGRALNKIRSWLNAKEKTRAVEIGKASLERECKRLKANFKAALEEGVVEASLKKVSLPDLDSLYAAIGYGKLSAKAFATQLVKRTSPDHQKVVLTSREAAREPAVVVRGATDLLTTLARCCKPIPGDEVVGFISPGRGLIIHRRDCTNVRKRDYNPDRFMEVEWTKPALSQAESEVHLQIVTEDKTGMVAAITRVVADLKSPLRRIDASVNAKDEGRIRISLLVRDKAHLNEVLNRFAHLQGIISVHRLNK